LTAKSQQKTDFIDLQRPLTDHLSLFNNIQINLSGVERRVNSLVGRRSVKNEEQVAWMLRAISCIDLTTLAGDDTPGRVARLCHKAKSPLRSDLLKQLGFEDGELTTGAVCVYHAMVPSAYEILKATNIPIAAVSTGFPAGLAPTETKLREIELSVQAGATEIDIVITRAHVLTQNWQALYDEIKAFKQACGKAHMKAIIATGELGSLSNVAKASMVAMLAGSDFIKTSTGMESTNANRVVTLVMLRMIREFYQLTGKKIGFKPAGGIRTAKEAINYLIMIKEELGNDWLHADLFRFGASALLTDLEKQIEYHLTNRYSADHRHSIA